MEMETKIEKMESRIMALENKKNKYIWLQFLVFPLILAAIGYYFDRTITQTEERVERYSATTHILNQIFTDTIYERTVAVRIVLDELIDNKKLSAKLKAQIDSFLIKRALEGTRKDFIEITSAIESQSTQKDSLFLVINESNRVNAQLNEIKKDVKRKERESYEFLLSDRFNDAKEAFAEVNEIYPTYHAAYEIYKYLEVQTDTSSRKKKNKIKSFIIRNYSWEGPKDIIEKIKKQIETETN